MAGATHHSHQSFSSSLLRGEPRRVPDAGPGHPVMSNLEMIFKESDVMVICSARCIGEAMLDGRRRRGNGCLDSRSVARRLLPQSSSDLIGFGSLIHFVCPPTCRSQASGDTVHGVVAGTD